LALVDEDPQRRRIEILGDLRPIVALDEPGIGAAEGHPCRIVLVDGAALLQVLDLDLDRDLHLHAVVTEGVVCTGPLGPRALRPRR